MRIRPLELRWSGATLLLAATLLFSAGAAGAVEIRIEARGPTSAPPGGTVLIDVFLDMPSPGLSLLAVSLLADHYAGGAGLDYDPAASLAAPVIHAAPAPVYGTTGSRPGYILYGPPVSGMSSFALYPIPSAPPWPLWPGTPTPNKQRIILSYADASFRAQASTGSDIWIGTFAFVVATGGWVEVDFVGVDFVATGDNAAVDITDQVVLGPPIFIEVPEPGLVAMVAVGMLATALLGKLRRRERV